MDALIFDTTFLIDFQRERTTGTGKAHEFLRVYAESLAFLSVTAFGEFAEGFESLDDPNFLSVVDSFEILPVTEDVARIYAGLTRALRAKGRLIGANDLWIAAIAIEKRLPLVTRNLEHFSRISRLEVRSY
ncbi:MAG: type II toxin-antitoxin system VapC family toxin [Terrimicrobiaceae bacterium]